MTGGQIVLVVLAAIVLFFILVLSIPVHLTFAYDEQLHLSVRYLFVKLSILPMKEKKAQDETAEGEEGKKKKKKKPKKPKKEKKKKEKKKPEQPAQAETGEKKENAVLSMVKANGFDGMMEVLGNLGRVFARFGDRLLKSVRFDVLQCYVTVGKGDAAETAIAYGKACQTVYPLFGFLCSNYLVKRYDVAVDVDFLANKSSGEFYIDGQMVLRKIINAAIAMVVRLIFKVLVKFLSNAKKGKGEAETAAPAAAPAAQSTGSKMKG